MTAHRSAGPKKDETSGGWGFVVDLGPGPDGQRRQARRRGFPTKKAAQEAMDASESEDGPSPVELR